MRHYLNDTDRRVQWTTPDDEAKELAVRLKDRSGFMHLIVSIVRVVGRAGRNAVIGSYADDRENRGWR